jgi:hypothetical protein
LASTSVGDAGGAGGKEAGAEDASLAVVLDATTAAGAGAGAGVGGGAQAAHSACAATRAIAACGAASDVRLGSKACHLYLLASADRGRRLLPKAGL